MSRGYSALSLIVRNTLTSNMSDSHFSDISDGKLLLSTQFIEQFADVEGITGSTVVLTCCKADSQSQWETPIFGPSQLGNALTDFDKV